MRPARRWQAGLPLRASSLACRSSFSEARKAHVQWADAVNAARHRCHGRHAAMHDDAIELRRHLAHHVGHADRRCVGQIHARAGTSSSNRASLGRVHTASALSPSSVQPLSEPKYWKSRTGAPACARCSNRSPLLNFPAVAQPPSSREAIDGSKHLVHRIVPVPGKWIQGAIIHLRR